MPRRKSARSDRSFTPSRQVANARNAFLFAEQEGYPLNTFLTIDYVRMRGPKGWNPGRTSLRDFEALRERVTTALRDFCDRQGIPNAYVYGVENDPAGGHGIHIHLLLHLPPTGYAARREALEGCVRKMMGWTRSEIDAARAAGNWLPFFVSLNNKKQPEPLTADEALGKLRYLSKSIDPKTPITVKGRLTTLGEHAKLDDDGIPLCASPPVTLQRQSTKRPNKCIGAARVLDQGARKTAGWIDATGFEWMSRDAYRDQMIEMALAAIRSFRKPPPPAEDILLSDEEIEERILEMELQELIDEYGIDKLLEQCDLKNETANASTEMEIEAEADW